jgi:hypothetical protein
MVTRQALVRRNPPKPDPSEPVHFTAGERFACAGDGNWRTADTQKVTCEECKQSRAYREMVARFRDPLEILEDKDKARDRVDYWIGLLRKGPVGQTGLWHRYGVEYPPRQIHTATGPVWGIFIAPFDKAGIEYAPSVREVLAR